MNLDSMARQKISSFVLSLMGEYFKCVEERLELEVRFIVDTLTESEMYLCIDKTFSACTPSDFALEYYPSTEMITMGPWFTLTNPR